MLAQNYSFQTNEAMASPSLAPGVALAPAPEGGSAARRKKEVWPDWWGIAEKREPQREAGSDDESNLTVSELVRGAPEKTPRPDEENIAWMTRKKLKRAERDRAWGQPESRQSINVAEESTTILS